MMERSVKKHEKSQGRVGSVMANSLDVVHFILDHRVGGPHVYVDTLRRAMSGQVNGRLVTAGRGDLTDVALVNLRQIWRFLYPLEVLLNSILIVFRFGILLRPDLFHVHGAANMAPILAAFLCRMPVVWHLHETTTAHAPIARFCWWLVKCCPHRLLTVARGSNPLLTTLNGVSDEVKLVPGLVDPIYWRRVTKNIVTRQSVGPFRLVTVANLNPLKGIDILLDALPLVGHSIDLQIIGSTLQTQQSFAKVLNQKMACLANEQIDLRIHFSGKQDPQGVRAALAEADAFVLPSRSEACPIALLEAMAMGLPCIATAVGAVQDMLPPEASTFICPPEQPDALAAVIRKLIDSTVNERNRLGILNREAVLKQFTPERVAFLVLGHYHALLIS